jgi:hypothetical protein
LIGFPTALSAQTDNYAKSHRKHHPEVSIHILIADDSGYAGTHLKYRMESNCWKGALLATSPRERKLCEIFMIVLTTNTSNSSSSRLLMINFFMVPALVLVRVPELAVVAGQAVRITTVTPLMMSHWISCHSLINRELKELWKTDVY